MQGEIHTEPGTPRLFENPVLEVFTRTHPVIVPSIFLPVSAFLIWYSIARAGVSPLNSTLLAVGGIFAWTLVEYWLHRTIMHWIPDAKWGERMHFWVHGIHHTWPNDPLRLVMPPTISIALFLIFLGAYRLILGPYAWAFQAGFTVGYIAYDLTHYYLHHGKPRWKWARKLQRHHLLHHFSEKHEDLRYGVSNSFWDHVFRTYEVRETKEDRVTAR
jgi:sterol desaturase/sphingolipid hydroxylase (fatty acid hydroxylase superfamily)